MGGVTFFRTFQSPFSRKHLTWNVVAVVSEWRGTNLTTGIVNYRIKMRWKHWINVSIFWFDFARRFQTKMTVMSGFPCVFTIYICIKPRLNLRDSQTDFTFSQVDQQKITWFQCHAPRWDTLEFLDLCSFSCTMFWPFESSAAMFTYDTSLAKYSSVKVA